MGLKVLAPQSRFAQPLGPLTRVQGGGRWGRWSMLPAGVAARPRAAREDPGRAQRSSQGNLASLRSAQAQLSAPPRPLCSATRPQGLVGVAATARSPPKMTPTSDNVFYVGKQTGNRLGFFFLRVKKTGNAESVSGRGKREPPRARSRGPRGPHGGAPRVLASRRAWQPGRARRRGGRMRRGARRLCPAAWVSMERRRPRRLRLRQWQWRWRPSPRRWTSSPPRTGG